LDELKIKAQHKYGNTEAEEDEEIEKMSEEKQL